MRLICPNCDAQYEVPEAVMPPEGRDVQCSNCGQTWFQEHPDYPEFDEDEEDRAEEAEAEAAAALSRREPDRAQAKPAADRAEDPGHGASAPVRRSLDPAVADILREEADYEYRARGSAKGEPLESQAELGIDDAGPGASVPAAEQDLRVRNARERMTRLNKPPSGAAERTAPLRDEDHELQSRRDLLPDIEEINSTLRSSSERIASGDPTEIAAVTAREKKSSLRGFTLTILLVAILALVYMFAKPIAEALPQADPWLSAYVGMVDSCRIWLDRQVAEVLGWLKEIAEQKGAADAAGS
ncbi:zinc-ribbon domain-containing protein [Sulfitobacter sp. LCG007]